MSRAGFVVLGPGLVAPSPGAGARKSKVRELGRSEGRKVGNVGVRRTQPEFPRLEARGSRPKAQGPRPKVQGPRSKVQGPSPSPSPSLEAHAKPSSPENPGDPKPLRIAETPASRQAAESNT
ncbi:hypothetical protein DO73_4075 [Burkholderia pseudomallei]|nr:hypothetical protein DO73_4075 [Burkholderia pseudomallei]